jgi:hypothetical protein
MPGAAAALLDSLMLQVLKVLVVLAVEVEVVLIK